MNQRIWSSLTFTLLTTAIGTTPSHAEPIEAVNQSFEAVTSVAGVQQMPATATPISVQYSALSDVDKRADKPKVGQRTPIPLKQTRSQMRGIASWYGPGLHGRRSASGERFNQHAMTAAHRSLPFGTHVRVTNLNNGRSVVVRINDRGPFTRGRVIDLSAAAAGALRMKQAGTAPVQVEIVRAK
ncbi:MAG: septal ring lytic transglycosylase RlpA family protein [Symploca sp. SIO3C6]|uniref:Probable endolytic peptidoglycan transglycosylase RlpA n=1 Tax=Symploca sp. SIO1C4 TaxID=2607765 RepID=A0A6B3N6X2_9CYAN|nr:septal ring lytic transglycosylase RlpA family protein [Symploca sp. SIO3C6]NER27347.1 septal ring lytic transglycosylase RlpA family protein [Symploca sp. SIO1C4]NET05522.1 septal ring lytic transglycosylase RlpA family protein [Symploca sp. SIO2B6]